MGAINLKGISGTRMRADTDPLTTTGNILKTAVATLGLTCWAVIFSMALLTSHYDSVPSHLKDSEFEIPLDSMTKISALFLLFPLVFNLLVLCGGRLLGRQWKELLLSFVHALMYEFGLFWGIFVLGYLLFY